MSLTLKLSDEEATALHAKAAAEGLSLEQWIRKLAEPEPTRENATAHNLPGHIWDIIAENMKDVPREHFAALPKDGLTQIDHYVYGVPKNTP